MERLESAGVHVLCLSKHHELSNSLGSSICNALTPGANTGLVTIPIMSALSVAFPGASSVSVSVALPNGLLATVGNLLKVGPANVGFSSTHDTVAGIAAGVMGGVSTTSKAGRLAMVTGLRPEHGSTCITSMPLYSTTCSNASDRASLMKHFVLHCEELQKALWRPERCVGSITLSMPSAFNHASEELQEKCFSNLCMLSMALSFDIGDAAFAVQRATSALSCAVGSVDAPTPPRRRSSATYSPVDPPAAAPEDVEAEQSYSDLDEDYLAELAREVDDEDYEDEDGTFSGCAAEAPCMQHRHDDDACDPSANVLPTVDPTLKQPHSDNTPKTSQQQDTQDAASTSQHTLLTSAVAFARKNSALMTLVLLVLTRSYSVACFLMCLAAVAGLLCSVRGGWIMGRRVSVERQQMLLLLLVALLTQAVSSVLPMPVHVGNRWLHVMAWAPVVCLAGPGMSWLPWIVGLTSLVAYPQVCAACQGNVWLMIRTGTLVVGRFVMAPLVVAMCFERIPSS